MSEQERDAAATDELQALLFERVRQIEGLVAPHLKALQSTGVVDQFGALLKSHDPATAFIKIGTDLSLRVPSPVSDTSPFATVLDDETRYGGFRGEPDMFTYDSKIVRLRVDRDLLYKTWQDIMAQAVGHFSPAADGVEPAWSLNEYVLV